MKGWQTMPIRDLLAPNESANPRQEPERIFTYIDVSSVSNKTRKVEEPQLIAGKDAPSRAKKLVRTNDVIFATIRPTMLRVALIPAELDGQICSTAYVVLRPKPLLSSKYLFYWLFSARFANQMAILERGASYPAVSDSDVRNQPISFPSMEEQDRIVAILDNAFEGINALEKCALNSLLKIASFYESQKSLLLNQAGWEIRELQDCFKVRSGAFLPASAMKREGTVPVLGGNGQIGFHDAANLTGENVVIGRVGAKCGNVRYTRNPIWLTDNALFISEYLVDFDPEFLSLVLETANLRKHANQMAQPVISYSTIRAVKIAFPKGVNDQREVLSALLRLAMRAADYRSCVDRKLLALAELSQSLLHHAFSGNL